MTCRIAIGCIVFGMVAASALAVPPTINVTWEESPPPQPDDDYIITTTDPDFPDIELVSESDTWRIFSEDADNPGGIGDIGVISSPYPKNFGVKIEDDLGVTGRATSKESTSIQPMP